MEEGVELGLRGVGGRLALCWNWRDMRLVGLSGVDLAKTLRDGRRSRGSSRKDVISRGDGIHWIASDRSDLWPAAGERRV